MGAADQPRPKSRLAVVELLLNAINENASAVQRLLTQTRAEVEGMLREEREPERDGELDRLRREAEQLQESLASMRVIERAKGILMQRHGISDAKALALLEEEAQRTHRTLRDVAADVANATPATDGKAPASSPDLRREGRTDGRADRERVARAVRGQADGPRVRPN